MKICDTCRINLSKEPVKEDFSFSEPEAADISDVYVHTPEVVASFNKCLSDIGETPYSRAKARGKNYSRRKVRQITDAMKQTIISGELTDDGSEMIHQLKEKFRMTSHRSEQLQILTVLPMSWSVKKNSTRIWCLRLYGTTIQRTCLRKRYTLSSLS